MRGEREPERILRDAGGGSSPHARGTQSLGFKEKDITRFIPACAGNADNAVILFHAAAVHPRMRGERYWSA